MNKSPSLGFNMGGWSQYFNMRNARRELGGQLKQLGWQVDDSKPENDPQTDYFPSTHWYPEWARKDGYTLHLNTYGIFTKASAQIDPTSKWVLVKSARIQPPYNIVAQGRNYRPAKRVAEHIDKLVR